MGHGRTLARMTRLAGLVVLFATGPLIQAAQAQSGEVKAVDPNATADGGAGIRTLALGSDVQVGEKIATDDGGQVQILFTDDTRLVVGPHSTLVIEQYLLRGNQTASRFVIDSLGGTFRFLTGNSPKNAYAINTPTGTIGVRGTIFDWTNLVLQGLQTTLVLRHEGQVLVCPRGGAGLHCAVLRKTCATAELVAGRDAHIIEIEDERIADMLYFPLVQSQSNVLRDFRATGATRCSQRIDDSLFGPPPTHQSNNKKNRGQNVNETTAPDEQPMQPVAVPVLPNNANNANNPNRP